LVCQEENDKQIGNFFSLNAVIWLSQRCTQPF